MLKSVYFPLLCAFFIFSSCSLSQARSIIQRPQSFPSFKLNTTDQYAAPRCSYTVVITTSCSSPRYTRDQISLAFGDAYGYEVYAPSLDDSTRTFEACSTDTFEVYGPCTYQICYLYLYRSGYDGWKPYTVDVYGYYTRPVSFYYNTFIPADVWYGFDYCYDYFSTSASTAVVE